MSKKIYRKFFISLKMIYKTYDMYLIARKDGINFIDF